MDGVGVRAITPEVAPLAQTDRIKPPSGGRAEWLKTADGVRLRAGYWPPLRANGRGTAVIYPGRTEAIEKYYETIVSFRLRGFAVAVIDWRGQGASDRALYDKRKGHVGHFAEYQRDVDVYLNYLLEIGAPKPWLLVAHSMGGAIAARSLMRMHTGELGHRFPGCVMSAPMLGLHGSPAFTRILGVASRFARKLGWARDYVLTCDWETTADQGFDGNVMTTDPKRFETYAEMTLAHTELALGGPTWGWLGAAVKEMRRLKPTATPTLIGVGTDDIVVSVEASQNYVTGCKDGRLLLMRGARHEPFLEADAHLLEFWRAIDAFTEQYGFGPKPEGL